jgi:hypothetical protein
VIETLLDPRQAMASCLDQWRHAIVACDDVRLPDQVRDIESVSRMVYSVMLDTVAELESCAIAATAGFRDTKQLLAGMLNLSPTEAGARVAHASQLAVRRAVTSEILAPVLPKHRRGTGRRGDRPGAGPGDHRDDDRDPHLRRRPRSRGRRG